MLVIKSNQFSVHPIEICEDLDELCGEGVKYIWAQVDEIRSLCYRVHDETAWEKSRRIFEFGGTLRLASEELVAFRGAEQNVDGSYTHLVDSYSQVAAFYIFQGLHKQSGTQLFSGDYFQVTGAIKTSSPVKW